MKELEKVIARRSGARKEIAILSSIPGMGHGFTAMSLACRIGRVERFPRAHSLANYWGLTPGCRNSGENQQRLGSITKAGSGMARWLLAQVLPLLSHSKHRCLPSSDTTRLTAGEKIEEV